MEDRKMLRIDFLRKFRAAIFFAALLWLIALVQIITTRIFVANTGFTQAFARNQVTVLEGDTAQQNEDLRNNEEGNSCTVGSVPGQLKSGEQARLANNLFGTLGGATVMTGGDNMFSDYYVAYGYTSGIGESKKINGKRINMNVAMSYDENSNTTKIIMGTPLINTDW